MLRTEPSFEIYSSVDGFGEEKEGVRNDGVLHLEGSVTIGESIDSGDFSFGKKGMGLIEEEEDDNEKEQDDDDDEGVLYDIGNLNIEGIDRPLSPPMYLATGFGMDGNGVGGGGGFGLDFKPSCFDEVDDVEEFYRKMVSEDPSNPLFLRNYAQLLQSKGDLSGAEELYFRATLVDPNDSEILLQYAKLVWELHRDRDRALNYFEFATQAAPEDSHVLAAYASFLWEIEEEDKHGDFASTNGIQIGDGIALEPPNSSCEEKTGSSVAGSGIYVSNSDCAATLPGEDCNIEDYYKRMVEENSSDPLFLRNYAQFLYQSKGDLKGAEDYYSRATLANPGDGEIISQYANLVWELYHDHDKALCYFERAVQSAPEDSHVLAAYARFLWETDNGEEDGDVQNNNQLPVFQLASTPAANSQLLASG